jgi:predicted AAA+ superfamily ATPase
MIPRIAETELKKIAGYFPVVSLNGPRQSGKTTLIKKCFPDMPYASLEDPDNRLLVEEDARRFLQTYPEG